MATKAAAEKVTKKVTTVRPVVERVAKDKQFQKHVTGAYGSARTIYDDLFLGAGPPTASQGKLLVARLAQDPELQEELRNVFTELRSAGKRAKKSAKPSHKGRNALLMAGIVVGVLYNPKTGPETRRKLKEKVFGPEETFEFET
jgi:hypothetical protein